MRNLTNTQKTGRALKVGDIVRRAKTVPGVVDVPRELGGMKGVIVKVLVGRGSGAMGHRRNSVIVRWASGSEARHDAHMIVKVEA